MEFSLVKRKLSPLIGQGLITIRKIIRFSTHGLTGLSCGYDPERHVAGGLPSKATFFWLSAPTRILDVVDGKM